MKAPVIIPDDAIKRLQALEHLPASSKRRDTPTTTHAGPETPCPASSARSAVASSPADKGLSRRPRELPWLVTPPPSVNHATAVAAAAVGSPSRRARPSTTPATTAGATSGARGANGELSRSASVAMAAGGSRHPQEGEQQQQGRKGGSERRPQSNTRAATAGAGAGRGGRASGQHESPPFSPVLDTDDPEAEHFAAEAAAAAAELAASEWSRQRRRALACAGSMEVPVGSSSSASTGAGSAVGGDAPPGSAAVPPFGLGGRAVLSESLSLGGRGGDGGDDRGSPLRGRGKGIAGQPKNATDGRGVLPIVPPPHPGSPKKTRTANARAAAWLALVKTAAFVDKSSATLRATSALPLDGLEAGLLALQPFRFGAYADSGDRFSSSSSSSSSSPRPSSASSTTSSSSLSHMNESEDGGRHGDDEAEAIGGDNAKDSGGRGGHEAGQSPGGARGGRADKNADRNERESKEDTPTTLSPASPADTPPKAEGTAAPLNKGGSPTLPLPDEPRTDSPAARRHGWVRSRSPRGARSRRSGSGGGGRLQTPTRSGCWIPPPTRWGGTPIKSTAFWEVWGEGSAAVAHARQEEGAADKGCDGPRSRSTMRSPFGDDGRGGGSGEQEPSEWDEQEEPQEDSGGGFGIASEFFRTSDGRPLFAESLGNLSSDDSIKRIRPQIQWGDVVGSGRRPGKHQRGFLCLLGEEGCSPSERGAAEAKRLGVAARHRRTRIDARSRDGKRRAEMLVAREKIKRLEADCISRRTDKLEWRANLTKSRGEAAVQVMGNRVKTLLWVVALASRTRFLVKRVVDGKRRRAILRNHMALVASAMRVQRAWRSYHRETATKKSGMLHHIQTIMRVSSKFIMCKRARVVALLKLWPEGEAAVKLEMRTGKRIRGEGSWKAPVRRRSSRVEAPHSSAHRGSMLGVAGGGGTAYVDSLAAAAAAAAATHVPAPWFPPLVQQMESRKNETAHNLIKSQGKLFRHRRANEAAWMCMTPVGRAYQQGHLHDLQQQEQLQRHARPNHRSGPEDEETFGSGGGSASGEGSLPSTRTDATGSTAESAATVRTTAAGPEGASRDNSDPRKQQRRGHKQRHSHNQQQQQQKKHARRRRKKNRPRPSYGSISSAETSEDDGTQGSVSSSLGSFEQVSGASAGAEGGERTGKDGKKKKMHSHSTSGHGGRKGSGTGGGGGGSTRRVSISVEKTLGDIFNEGGGGSGGHTSAVPASSGVQFSRTTPAASSAGQMHRIFSATGGMQYSHASSKKAVPIRDLTSMQLLSGPGWLARLAEIEKDTDTAPLVPLAVKLSTIESFMRAEMTAQVKLSWRDRASQRARQEEATIDTAKALLHSSIEDFEDKVEAANSRQDSDVLQLFSGGARSRFTAEVDRRVRAYMEKGGNRRAQIGVRT